MFICNYYGNILQYTLSTAYDVSSASYDSVAYNPSEAANLQGLEFKADGTKMYVMDYGGTDSVFQYSLSTAWDISTASYDSKSFSLSSQDTSNQGIFMRQDDGLKLYLMAADDKVYQYTLSTAWDISTASYDSKSYSVNSEETTPTEVFFSSDGLKFFISGLSGDDVTEYSMTTAWDVSTASPTGNTVLSQATQPYGLFFKPDGTKMYIVTDTNDTIYQYSTGSTVATATFDTSTGNYFTHTPSADSEYGFSNAGDVQTFQLEVTGNQAVVGYDIASTSYDNKTKDVSSEISFAYGIGFKSDGTKMYLCSSEGTGGGDVFQYTLSTAWDVSTATYDSVTYSNTNITNMLSLFFKPDGTKMYLQGYEDNRVYQHSLSTAWDLSTATYDSVFFYYGGQITSCYNFTMSYDGLKVYVSKQSTGIMYQYTMSTAWDLSTATYDSVTLNISTYTTSNGWFVNFNPDGTKMYGVTADDIYQFSLSTAWAINTATYDSVTAVLTQATSTSGGFAFGDNGTKLYHTSGGFPVSTAAVFQYTTSVSTPITITWDADIEWGGGTAPSSPASGQKDLYTITTDDGGTTYFGVPSGVAFS